MSKPIRSIAIIDPIGDFGIGGYVYELAEGLCANGVEVDVYTSGRAQMKDLDLPRRHCLIPVLGSFLFRQQGQLRAHLASASPEVRTGEGKRSDNGSKVGKRTEMLRTAVNFLMPLELAFHLKRRRYDLIWTQWPLMTNYGLRFWGACRALGMRMVHTVHNVLPHEDAERYRKQVGEVYRRSDTLIVHSDYSAQELLREFPACRGKALKMLFGLYTMYPKPQENESRLRERLGFPPDSTIVLFYGSIRPYKNLDAVLQALRGRKDAILIVAGRESGYPDLVPGKPLGRTCRLAASLGVQDNIRLIPGMLDSQDTSNLFAASDVLILPYLQSYGSGSLLLGMTHGLHIVATRTGGMDEYLERYPARTLLDGVDTASVSEGLAAAMRSLVPGEKRVIPLPHLDWGKIAGDVIKGLESGSFTA
jgi:glycosyltransferase involved in cell wall biosynthesis